MSGRHEITNGNLWNSLVEFFEGKKEGIWGGFPRILLIRDQTKIMDFPFVVRLFYQLPGAYCETINYAEPSFSCRKLFTDAKLQFSLFPYDLC